MPGQFACQYANCHRSYNRKEHLVRHEKSHGQFRPFRCLSCSAEFYRNDLLKRHIRLSSKCKAAANRDQHPLSNAASSEIDYLQHHSTRNRVVTDTSDLRNVIYEKLGPSFTKIASREEMERLYFCQFQPHWPLLDEGSFMNGRQIPELVTAVLVGGLWMIPTRAARLEARGRHDILMQELANRFHKEQPQTVDLTHISAECLPYFQTLLIPLIIFTYRGAEEFANAVMSSKHVFDLFQQAGVFQQEKIDEASSDPAVRQQYQRLGLLLFKVFMHYNCLMRIQFSNFNGLLNWFKPSILQIRVPSVETQDGTATYQRYDCNSSLVGDLLKIDRVDKVAQATIAALVAWDFPLGMVFACFITQKEDESRNSLLQRIEPNMLLHLAGWNPDPGD